MTITPQKLRFELDIEEDTPPPPTPEPPGDPVVVAGPKPKLTAVGRVRLRERFLMALEADPPGERKLTAVQKAAYVKWLDYHMAE